MKKICLILLLFLLPFSAFASEAIIFVDGKNLIAEKHECNGSSITITMPGGSIVSFDRSRIQEIRPVVSQDIVQRTSEIVPEQQAADCNAIIEKIAEKHSVDSTLVKAIIRVESNFNPVAVSPKGAQGLMQLMPGTAARFNVDNVFDPADNIEGGVKYLKFLTERYGNRFDLILAAYNAGEEAVEKHGGIPPYRETIGYVLKVLRLYNKS